MANNLIQIKRSASTAIPATLSAGELAYSNSTQVLYIGSTDAGATIVPIGGARNPGVLTANQALVANATSGIDKIIVANLQPTGIYANGTLGSAGYVLSSNGTSTYWAATATGLSAGDGLASNATHYYVLANNGITANSTGLFVTASGGLVANATGLHVGAGNGIAVDADSIRVVAGTGIVSNATGVHVAGAVSGVTTLAAGNTTITGWVSATGAVNATSFNAGANIAISQTSYFAGNSTANATLSATQIQVSNSTSTANLTPVALNIGTTVANSTALAAGANIVISTTSYFAGNSTANSTQSATLVQVANATSTANLTPLALTIGTTVANGTSVTTATAFANVSGSWANISGQVNTATLYAATSANVGTAFTVSASALSATVNSAFSGANLNITGANTYISANVNFAGANIVASSSQFNVRDLVVSGNLTVTGTTTVIDTTNLSVKDNMILLADQQGDTVTFSDLVDAGFAVETGNTLTQYFSGIARIAASSSNTNPYFKLYSTTVSPNNTIIDTNASTGTLQAFLAPYGTGGALIANSTVIRVAANATVNVAITANNLAWSGLAQNGIIYGGAAGAFTSLSAGAGGTVLMVSTAGVPEFATLDGGSF